MYFSLLCVCHVPELQIILQDLFNKDAILDLSPARQPDDVLKLHVLDNELFAEPAPLLEIIIHFLWLCEAVFVEALLLNWLGIQLVNILNHFILLCVHNFHFSHVND